MTVWVSVAIVLAVNNADWGAGGGVQVICTLNRSQKRY